MQTVNEKLLEASIRHGINLDSLSREKVREIISLLKDGNLKILGILAEEDLTYLGRERMLRILNEIKKVSVEAYRAVNKKLKDDLLDIAEYEVDYNKNLLETTLPVELSVSTVTRETLISLIDTHPIEGDHVGDWVNHLYHNKRRAIEKAIKMGVLDGDPTGKIIRTIRGTRKLAYKDGVIEKCRSEIEALVRTSINSITTQARNELYKANTDIVKKWKFVATLDSRTSLNCASLDGKTYDIGTGPMPPRHFNCRSTTAPIVKSWKELGVKLSDHPEGVRSSLDGAVPESLNYSDWLHKQDKSFVEEILGKKRANLFIENQLNIDKFVNNSGGVLSLKDLKKLDSSLFN